MPLISLCSACSGRTYEIDGEGAVTYDPCRTCGGSGEVFGSKILTDMVDKLNDIIDKCNDIFDKLNE